MAASRRPGDESRRLLIEAAVAIIRTEGYGALTARALAECVGLKRQIVHYYFRTIEDLLLAVVRYYGELGLAALSSALEHGDPLRVIWETEADASETTFAFMAMASHSPSIRNEVRDYLEAFRQAQIEAVSTYLKANDLQLTVTPAAAVVMLQTLSHTLSGERALGTSLGHDDVCAAVHKLLLGRDASSEDQS